jgi:hypothetical protein
MEFPLHPRWQRGKAFPRLSQPLNKASGCVPVDDPFGLGHRAAQQVTRLRACQSWPTGAIVVAKVLGVVAVFGSLAAGAVEQIIVLPTSATVAGEEGGA